MKIARFMCYGCRQEYTHIFPENCHEIECPCGQWNIAPATAEPITGRCKSCGNPIDDHSKGGRCP